MTKINSEPKPNKKIILFVISLVAALMITWLMRDSSFTESQTYVLFLLLFSIGLWLTEAVPAFAVGLLIIAFLAFSQGYEQFTSTPQDIKVYINTFSSSVIWLMLGGFFLASAMTKTKLDNDLVRITLRVCGKNPKWILFGMMTITMVMSMLISNTAATAMVLAALMPLIAQIGSKSSVSKGLILGIPIAATAGGMGTIIGSPPNAIAVGAMTTAGFPIDFVTWLYYGVPMGMLLTLLGWFVIVWKFMRKVELVDVTSQTEIKTDMPAGFTTDRIIVMTVLVVTLGLWLTNPLHGLSSAAVSAVPLIALTLTGVLKNEDVRAVGWDTLLLVAGGMALGIGLQESGLLNIYAGKIASLHVPPVAFYFLLAYAAMAFSNIMSNTATSTVLIPLGMSLLPENITEVCLIIGLSASTALLLPVSTPPNAIAYNTGLIQQSDLRLGGVVIGLVGPALIVLWVLAIAG